MYELQNESFSSEIMENIRIGRISLRIILILGIGRISRKGIMRRKGLILRIIHILRIGRIVRRGLSLRIGRCLRKGLFLRIGRILGINSCS